MNTGPDATKKKWPVKRTIFISALLVLVLAGIYFYNNFNRLLSDALMKSFNSSVISDVYELKFEDLRVNLAKGSIRVYNVTMLPREKPEIEYPYINSSFSLKTENILLENVEIRTLLNQNRLILTTIQITKPEIEFLLNGTRHVMLPFSDSTKAPVERRKTKKRPIESFTLNEFQLIDASFHSINSNKLREFSIHDLDISVFSLALNQQPSAYQTSLSRVNLSIGKFAGNLEKDKINQVGFADFEIGIDSLALQLTLDTLTYQFHDFNTKLKDLDIQTADSLFHLTLQSFDLSYKDKSIILDSVRYIPNVSHMVLQRKHQYQNTQFSGTVGKLELRQVNFDSLIYARKLFIDEVVLDNVKASLFKDKTKPMDSARRPVYLGQTIRSVSLPLLIKRVTATHVNLENTERKPDSTYAKVTITRAHLEVRNITNLSSGNGLFMKADAYINDKAHFKAGLTFSYRRPEFNFEGTVEKFNLPDLTPLIQAYTPAKINKGISDEIVFSGLAGQTRASGTMKFLYHDLEVDLELLEKAKWKSSVIAFAANSVLNSSNPPSVGQPPRIVKFQIDRDMTKGFVNVIIKSILNGLKETMIMSKENRKEHKETRKKSRQENKK